MSSDFLGVGLLNLQIEATIARINLFTQHFGMIQIWVNCFKLLWNIYNWKPAQYWLPTSLLVSSNGAGHHALLGAVLLGMSGFLVVVIKLDFPTMGLPREHDWLLWDLFVEADLSESDLAVIIGSESIFVPSSCLILSLQKNNNWIPCALLLLRYIADLNHPSNSKKNVQPLPIGTFGVNLSDHLLILTTTSFVHLVHGLPPPTVSFHGAIKLRLTPCTISNSVMM